MKKLFLMFTALMLTVLPVITIMAEEQVPLKVKIITTGDNQNQPPKTPILVPVVYLDGNVVSFDESLEGCTVQLLDESENIVFADSIEENQTLVTFPSTLTGTYELEIVRGGITFYAYIEL